MFRRVNRHKILVILINLLFFRIVVGLCVLPRKSKQHPKVCERRNDYVTDTEVDYNLDYNC